MVTSRKIAFEDNMDEMEKSISNLLAEYVVTSLFILGEIILANCNRVRLLLEQYVKMATELLSLSNNFINSFLKYLVFLYLEDFKKAEGLGRRKREIHWVTPQTPSIVTPNKKTGRAAI